MAIFQTSITIGNSKAVNRMVTEGVSLPPQSPHGRYDGIIADGYSLILRLLSNAF
jgi:hypothetical protein